MKIGNNKPPIIQPGTADKPSAPATKSFGVSREKVSPSLVEDLQARYKAGDLDDPQKAAEMRRATLDRMVGQDPVAAKLPEDRRQELVGFLESDPIIQAKLNSALRKLLS